jgi:hypothetical protein
MRRVVANARDWQPAPAPHPEQIWFPGASRQVALPAPEPAAAAVNPNQHQLCE